MATEDVEITDTITVACMQRQEPEYIYSFDNEFDGITRLNTAGNPFAERGWWEAYACSRRGDDPPSACLTARFCVAVACENASPVTTTPNSSQNGRSAMGCNVRD